MSLSHVDVLIVGAGLSGIGAARHLQDKCPDRTFALLESRAEMGGTWDLFRYPGIRSDSDMYTLGYAFKPWTNPKAIADGPSILSYIRETAAETGVDAHIHYHTKVLSACWDSGAARWTVVVENTASGAQQEVTCCFLFMATGYYDYAQGFTPDFDGVDNFQGTIMHAQHWNESYDYTDKSVIVIGSGATAVTVVPEVAKKAAHTVMLQRSPTYVASVPGEDRLANWMRRWLPLSWAYGITRWKKVLFQLLFFNIARRWPQKIKAGLVSRVQDELGPEYDVKTHFTPSYNPWDERLCAVPDGDMFESLRSGSAEVVTDHIDHFTTDGIHLKSGKELKADLIVYATGLNLKFLGDVTLQVDGRDIQGSDLYCYRGMMYSGIPNLAQAFGYTNSSWTLKVDLTCEYMCRVLNRMAKTGAEYVVPEPAGEINEIPFLDFSSGYVQRALHLFPKQGDKTPWRLYQNYAMDIMTLRYASLDDGVLQFKKAPE